MNKYIYVLPLQLTTSYSDREKALTEVKENFEKQNKFDTDKIKVSKTVALLAQRKDGPKNNPNAFKFFFLSNDRNELQKLADNWNQKMFGNDLNAIDVLGARIARNSRLGNFTV